MEAQTTTPEFYPNLGTTYQTAVITSGKTVYSITKKTGRINQVTVRKVSANPYGLMGKDFADFDTAQQAFKLPVVKTMILLAESLLK